MYIVTANSYAQLESLLDAKPEGIILPIDSFSLRAVPFLDNQGFYWYVQKMKEKGIKVYLNALKMLVEEELEEAEEILDLAGQLDLDGIYIADEAWIEMAKPKGLVNKLIYQPETLVVNALDADFYADLGLQAVSLAHELSLAEIEAIAKESHANLEVLIQGTYSWMDSRRPLLSNYLRAIQSPEEIVEGQMYQLQEETRRDRMKAVEDQAGTHIFSSSDMNSASVFQHLLDAGITRFRIETLFQDEDYGKKQLARYRAIEAGSPLPEPESEKEQGSDATYFIESVKRKEK